MAAPDITFRTNSQPFNQMSSFFYSESKLGSGFLPVLQGEESNSVLFRIYNNFALNSGISVALNVSITTYDGATQASHTAFTLPVSQSWLHVLEHGFGENSVSLPDLYTRYDGTDTPVGGNNIYFPEKGSNGAYDTPNIRAGITGSGTGYIELKSYCTVPDPTPGDTYSFVITVNYEYVS